MTEAAEDTQVPEVAPIHEAIDSTEQPTTPGQLLGAAYDEAAKGVKPLTIQLYGYGEPETELFTVCRYVADLKEIADAVRDAIEKRAIRPEDKARNVAMATLPFVSESSYALIGGERHEMPPLGLELYAEIFPDRPQPQKDEQATWLLFHEEDGPLVQAYMQYARYQRSRGLKVEDEALGE